MEEAEEKVDLANQIYDLVERYLKRLDSELQKFKIELEVDNSGITEILEKSMFNNYLCIISAKELYSLAFLPITLLI